MFKKISMACLAFILIFLAELTLGLPLEYKDYEIKKGDTLWDISSAELNDPFLWPNIWKENPKIKNPDLIYPTQLIRIPVYLLQKQVRLAPPLPPEIEPSGETPEIEEIAEEIEEVEEIEETPPPIEEIKPARREHLLDKNLVMISGYISRKIPSIGMIRATPSGRKIVGKDDYVYIEVEGDTTPGRKFYAFRQPFEHVRKVRHPEGGSLGYLIEITGIVEIIGEESGNTKALITQSFLDVTADEDYGNYLQDYYEVEPPLKTDQPRTPDIKGMIVHTRDLRELNAEGDIVYIDKGSDDGVLPGDVFYIESGRYPHVPLGNMIIILTKEATSTALVRKSTDVVRRGDTF